MSFGDTGGGFGHVGDTQAFGLTLAFPLMEPQCGFKNKPLIVPVKPLHNGKALKFIVGIVCYRIRELLVWLREIRGTPPPWTANSQP